MEFAWFSSYPKSCSQTKMPGLWRSRCRGRVCVWQRYFHKLLGLGSTQQFCYSPMSLMSLYTAGSLVYSSWVGHRMIDLRTTLLPWEVPLKAASVGHSFRTRLCLEGAPCTLGAGPLGFCTQWLSGCYSRCCQYAPICTAAKR